MNLKHCGLTLAVVLPAIAVANVAHGSNGPPPGDECETAEVVTDGSTGDFSLMGYSGTTGDDTTCGVNDVVDRWFVYHASCTGTATAEICTEFTDVDITIAVFNGSCGGPQIACGVDNPGCPFGADLNALVSWNAIAGQAYYIRVSGEGATSTVNFIGSMLISCDPLVCDGDTTPPLVDITAPAFDTCFCGDDLVPVEGSVSDPDGTYFGDSLHYRPVNADPADPWILVSTAFGEFTGTLHTWDTTGIPGGRYYLRVTGTNACGLSQSDVTVVCIDRNPPNANLITPADKETICGMYEIEGVACDGKCPVDSWMLKYAPTGGSTFTTIATANSGACCPSLLGVWDTTTIADGDYTLRLTVVDHCGFVDESFVLVTVDNSEGYCECTPDINGDGVVDVLDLLLVLGHWGVFP